MKEQFKNWYLRVKLPYWVYHVNRLFAQSELEALCYKAYLKGRKDEKESKNDPS